MPTPITECPLCGEPRANFDRAAYGTQLPDETKPVIVEGCKWCGTSFLAETLDEGAPHGRSPNAPEFLLPPGERTPEDADGLFLVGASRGPAAPTECGRRGMNHRFKRVPRVPPEEEKSSYRYECQNPDCAAFF